MTQGEIITLAKDAFVTTMLLAGPLLLVSLLVGLVVAVFQAATQVHEQTLSFVPKIIVMGLVLIFLGSWMISVMVNYTIRLYGSIGQFM
jgi:flagellar biosynthetic protein FliQ